MSTCLLLEGSATGECGGGHAEETELLFRSGGLEVVHIDLDKFFFLRQFFFVFINLFRRNCVIRNRNRYI
jgi:hypothetical protein